MATKEAAVDAVKDDVGGGASDLGGGATGLGGGAQIRAAAAADLGADVADLGGATGSGHELLAAAATDTKSKRSSKSGRKSGKDKHHAATDSNDWMQIGSDFVKGFYKTLDTAPMDLHKWYNKKCEVKWNILDDSHHMVAAEEIQKKMSESTNQQAKFCLNDHDVQKYKRALHIVAKGVCTRSKSCNFFQSFLVDSESRLILKDVLHVVLGVSKFRFKLKQSLTIGAENKHNDESSAARTRIYVKSSIPTCCHESQPRKGADGKSIAIISEGRNLNQAGRRSARIEENRLRTCKQFEIPGKSEASSKKAMGKDPAEAAKKKVSKIPSDSREAISVAILYDDVMLGHKPEYHCLETDARMMKRKSKYSHVERPERITCIFNRLIKDNLFDRAVHVTHRPATLEDIQAVHLADYVRFINELPLGPKDLEKYVGYFTKDMYCSTGTREAVYSAAGATMKACDVVIRDLFKKAFAIVRPPGHHAGNDEAEGFCYVNNIAVAAAYLKRVYGIRKIIVVDWDVHHGNGTEKLFYSTDEVLFFNIFNMDLDYPKTSKEQAERIGRGKGAGHNVNVPLSSGFGDSDLLYVWEHLLIPLIKAYSPEIILVSCGFDAAQGDLLGKCEVSAPCYATLLDMIVNAGNGKVVLSLEGGYNLEVVANCASHVVRAMVGDKESLLAENVVRAPPMDDTVETVKEVKRNLQRFWEVFKQKPKQNQRR